MNQVRYNILVISAYPPSRSGGIALDMMNALENEGHNVDFFTMYAFKGQKENHYSIYPEPLSGKMSRLKQRFPFLGVFRSFAKRYIKTPEEKMSTVMNHGYRIPHLDEAKPPVDNDTLLNYLPSNKYDFILTYVTERMITTHSFISIYNKYKVPILIICMDMIHFTGGCYFFGDCKRFSEGCGKCLILDSEDENDQTHKNYLIKASVYKQIKYAILCNLYQKQFALKCNLFKPENIFTVPMLIDEDVFSPLDKLDCRRYFDIPEDKQFVIFSRYSSGMNRSKGYDHMERILNTFYDNLSAFDKKKCLLVLAGSEDDGFSKRLKIDTKNLGSLNLAELIKCYSMSSVFISTSIDDAGPSMVNQSMMCGTPVVTFKIGTALEVTREGINGFSANNYDDNEFANHLLTLFRMTEVESQNMRVQTRKSAMEMNSKRIVAKRIERIYQNVQSLYK